MNLVPFSHETSLRIAVSPSAKSGKDFLQNTSSLCISCSSHYTCKCAWLEAGCYRSVKLQLTIGRTHFRWLLIDSFACCQTESNVLCNWPNLLEKKTPFFEKVKKSSCKVGGLDMINRW